MKTQKSNLEHESVIISWILNKKKKTPDIENKFSKEYCKKEDEKKKMQPNYLEAFFPQPSSTSLSSVFGKEKFISAFISKLDAIYCLYKARFSPAVAANAYLPPQCGLGC